MSIERNVQTVNLSIEYHTDIDGKISSSSGMTSLDKYQVVEGRQDSGKRRHKKHKKRSKRREASSSSDEVRN